MGEALFHNVDCIMLAVDDWKLRWSSTAINWDTSSSGEMTPMPGWLLVMGLPKSYSVSLIMGTKRISK